MTVFTAMNAKSVRLLHNDSITLAQWLCHNSNKPVFNMTDPSKSALISAKELNAIIGNPHTKVFDVRGTWATPARALPESYDEGHIPGAAFLDWTKEFLEADIPTGLAPVANLEAATSSFKSLGINDGDFVVLYDDYHHMLSGRIWWAMRYWGFHNVKVLNGGWNHWVAQGLATSTQGKTPDEGSFSPKRHKDLRTSMEEFLLKKQTSCVLDGRGVKGFAGNTDDNRSGHIPGAINIPYSRVLDERTGLFQNRKALVRLFDQLAPAWCDTHIISSCGAGYAGTVLMLALLELDMDSTLFDDSFSVWKQDPSRPVERS